MKKSIGSVAAALIAIALNLGFTGPLAAELPDEIVLGEDAIIEVTIDGIPLRLEVGADEFGPPTLNPDVVQRLELERRARRGWQFGPVAVMGAEGRAGIDFGAGPEMMTVAWAGVPVTRRADGRIGVHDLPFRFVTFELGPRAAGETLQRFALRRRGGRDNTRIGTEIDVDGRRMAFIFSLRQPMNLVTAPTANFIATHHEGGFVDGSEGFATMRFDVQRPVREMRIAYPIQLGDLVIDRFAVRVDDYGSANRVGEIEENDPRFSADNILVSRRRGRGRPDRLTRLGRDQIAHCSRLTYDLEEMELLLTCAQQVSGQ